MARLPFLLVFVAALLGCGDTTTTSQPGAAAPFADAAISDLGKERWARTCALCHVAGEGGAPKVGDHAAWSTRLAQGEDTVLAHTIEGFNNMPPLGYCMDCEREDLRAYIHFMASGGGT
jgi:cytochrome c5